MKVNYIRERTRCRSNNFILLFKRSEYIEKIIIINGTGVLGQTQKMWSLAERKDETYCGSRNGQSDRI